MVDYKGKCWDKIKIKNKRQQTKQNKQNTPITKSKNPNQAKMVNSSRSRLLWDGHSKWNTLLLYKDSERHHTHIQYIFILWICQRLWSIKRSDFSWVLSC